MTTNSFSDDCFSFELPPWKAVGASIKGASHIVTNKPCQDTFTIAHTENHLLGVISDGAGTAELSATGSHTICSTLAKAFYATFPVDSDLSIETLSSFLTTNIEIARRQCLSSCASKGSIHRKTLHDFHATLVGCILASNGTGYFFQIGDGFGCAIVNGNVEAVSKPENGEYANETFFYTQDDWQDHLRLKVILNYTHVVLMSDGCMAFSVKKDLLNLEEGFYTPIDSYLTNAPHDSGAAALRATLASERASEISSDDKTFIWISNQK